MCSCSCTCRMLLIITSKSKRHNWCRFTSVISPCNLSFCQRFVCGTDWQHIVRSPFFVIHITQVRFSIQSSTSATVKPTVIHCTFDPRKKLTWKMPSYLDLYMQYLIFCHFIFKFYSLQCFLFAIYLWFRTPFIASYGGELLAILYGCTLTVAHVFGVFISSNIFEKPQFKPIWKKSSFPLWIYSKTRPGVHCAEVCIPQATTV